MPAPDAKDLPRRLVFRNGGFLNPRLRRILALTGHDLTLGPPRPGDGVVVWGRSPTAHRGEGLARRHGLPLIRIEDAFLRSLRPGRMGDAPLGLLIDPLGVHFDAATPSRLEAILATDPLDDTALLGRARDGMARMQASQLSKYNLHDPDLAPPAPGYVLVVDQTRGDASIRHSGASAGTFADMLAAARDEHPRARIVVKAHPETAHGLRPGHYDRARLPPGVEWLAAPVSPWALLQGAIAVYTVSSQLGYEAILSGHRPQVWGRPFYAGWGLTDDRHPDPFPRRRRSLTRAQLFAAAMILAPVWYDPCRDRLCPFEDALNQIEAEVRALRQDRHGHVALGFSLWKRGWTRQAFGRFGPVSFAATPARAIAKAKASARPLLVWGDRFRDLAPVTRVEDGFLRSRGLGAALVPPLSLVTDDLGLYYDPGHDSRLERLIAAPAPPGGLARAERLLDRLTDQGLTKYNLGGTALPDLPRGHRILIPGQVEDDASIRLGATGITTNRALIHAARTANPGAILIYKPHPDVEAGLRPGAIPDAELARLVDATAPRADPLSLIAACDEVWTLTSLLGFEALIRGKPVTCLGAPFYAGWGLTRDLGPIPARRLLGPDGNRRPAVPLLQLIHAALIAYPRYFDPVSRRPCPPEVAMDRLAAATLPRPTALNRALAKAQAIALPLGPFWRR